jgi:hypothetical protein
MNAKKMDKALSETESQIWEIPSIIEKDKSITKYDYVKI